MKREISFKSEFDCSQEELFDWHERPGAFARLNPYWEPVEILSHKGGIQDGAEVKLRLGFGPVGLTWHLCHQNYVKNQEFSDLQLSGPFSYWCHRHIIGSNKSNPANETAVLEDKIEYRLPLGMLGDFGGKAFTIKKLERLFAFRHRVTKADIAIEKIVKAVSKENKKMRILISGSSGLVGKDFSEYLAHKGHQVSRLLRSKNKLGDNDVYWDPDSGILDETQLDGFDAIVHLGGENIANKRWTDEQKAKIRDSRIDSTTLLANAIAKLKNPPKTFVCASAIGFYGDRPLEVLNENSQPVKNDYLSETCVAWENACKPAVDAGVRVVNTRFGIILSPKGGAMSKLLLPFQMGAGGNLGDGQQDMSWIALDDVIYALHYVLEDTSISGPVNFTAPKPVSNADFTKILGKVLFRPTLFPVPKFACKLVFGEMADALLLASAKVYPEVLNNSNFQFAYPDLESALRHLLGKEQVKLDEPELAMAS